jgi:glycosyltransferase involved in cell wall biosynthesis
MRILLINNQEIKGGSAVISKSLMLGLQKADHQVDFLVAHKESNDFNVHQIPTSKFRKFYSYLFSNDIDFYKTDYILDLDIFKKADIINFHNLSGHYFNLNTLQKISKLKPVLWTFHDACPINHYYAHSFSDKVKGGLFIGQGFNFLSKILWYRKKYLKRKKVVIYKNSNFSISSPSQWLIDRIKKTVLGNKKIYLIPNGIDSVFFKDKDKNEVRKLLKLPLDKKIILFMAHGGKNNPLKGWNYFLEAMKYYKNRKNVMFLVIGGSESNDSKVVRSIKYSNDRNKISQYYKASDVLFFPSIAENFPLTVIEAMAMGTPVLSFNVGGVKEVLTHKENGYLADYRNSRDLLNGLDYILNLSELELKQMAKKSREKIKNNFSIDKMTKNYLKVYHDLIVKYENWR